MNYIINGCLNITISKLILEKIKNK
jgi:hypothetical protein